MCTPLTELHNLASQEIASFLHYYDFGVDRIYEVIWENSKGVWRPCLECLKFKFVEDYCYNHDRHDHQENDHSKYFDFIRNDTEVLRMTDLITMDLEIYEQRIG